MLKISEIFVPMLAVQVFSFTYIALFVFPKALKPMIYSHANAWSWQITQKCKKNIIILQRSLEKGMFISFPRIQLPLWDMLLTEAFDNVEYLSILARNKVKLKNFKFTYKLFINSEILWYLLFCDNLKLGWSSNQVQLFSYKMD